MTLFLLCHCSSITAAVVSCLVTEDCFMLPLAQLHLALQHRICGRIESATPAIH